MQEKQAIILEASSSNFHILIVILKAYMLKHSDRDNMIKRFIEIPVICKTYFNRQIGAYLPAQGDLFAGKGYSYARNIIMFNSVLYEPAPSAADIENSLAGPEVKFSAD
ncbi:MAG: hypothetical protein PHY54_05235 [Methylococcales bacterium]|nr:hypothetical protein [Methylococcales bacterium]